MADKTHIEWTDATWNPITGCRLASEGCRNCYAATLAATRLKNHPSRAGLARVNAAGEAKFTGDVRFNAQWLDQPLRWKKPRRIFVCAHSDLFYEAVPDEWIDLVFAVMALAPQHTFQILTKRPERMRAYMDRHDVALRWSKRFPEGTDVHYKTLVRWTIDGLPNVWLGVSVEDQATADVRIPDLLATPAAIRWVSYEPALGPVDWDDIVIQDDRPGEQHMSALYCDTIADDCAGEPRGTNTLDWIVAGGESGPKARPAHPDWFRQTRDQCAAAGVDFLFKQWGEWLPWEPEGAPFWTSQTGCHEDAHALFPTDMDGHRNWDDGLWTVSAGETQAAFQRVGKRAAGRHLDGVLHDEYPEGRHD